MDLDNASFIAIPWNDGSNDNLYLDFSKLAVGDNVIRVSSDANKTQQERSRVFKFQGVQDFDESVEVSEDVQPYAVLNIVQAIDSQLVVTFNQSYSVYEEVNTSGL